MGALSRSNTVHVTCGQTGFPHRRAHVPPASPLRGAGMDSDPWTRTRAATSLAGSAGTTAARHITGCKLGNIHSQLSVPSSAPQRGLQNKCGLCVPIQWFLFSNTNTAISFQNHRENTFLGIRNDYQHYLNCNGNVSLRTSVKETKVK